MARLARSVEDVLLGEGVHGTMDERYEDFLGIASVISNRAALHGVTPDQIVSAKRQFDAYGRALPAGVEKYRALAKEAWDDVQTNGAINSATYFATPARVKGLPNGLNPVGATTGHRYFMDPQFRPIKTALGVKPANPAVAQDLLDGLATSEVPTPEMRPVDAGAIMSAYAGVPQAGGAVGAIEGLMGNEIGQAAQTVSADAGLNELGAVERDGYGSPLGAMGDRITSGFGARDRPRTSQGFGSSFHQGTDLSLGPGAANYPAEAVAGGVVSNVYRSPSLGNTVEVQHPDGMTSRYSHLNEIGNVEVGQDIARGTPIGTVGNTGNSGASHLHFSMMDPEGNAVDPASVVDFNRENELPTPTAAQRQQSPGDMISSLMNDAVSPSLDDPNEALAASFNMDRFAGPTKEQVDNFDAARFGEPQADPAQSFDVARMGGPMQQIQGEQTLADALTTSNSQAALNSAQMTSMQERANQARRELEQQVAQSAQEIQTASIGTPVTIDGQATASTGVSASIANAGLYDAMRVSPEQNLAADVADYELSKKTSRLPGFAEVQATVDPTYSQPTQTQQQATLDMGEFAEPEAVGDFGAVTTPTAGVQSRAKQAVEQGQPEKAKKETFDTERFAKSLTNSKTIGSALGAVLGGVLGGPVGAMALGGIGAKLGDLKAAERPRETPLQALFNMMIGKPQSMYPSTPPGGDLTGRGVGYGDLNEAGRGVYGDSGDFRDAIDKGGVGLY